jgi:hypothetical protein
LVQTVVKPVASTLINGAIADVLEIYEEQGETDNAAKSSDMREAVQEYLNKKYA